MKFKSVFIACCLYIIMSLSSVFLKIASLQINLFNKCIFYFISMITLGLFAILWQKILTKNELSKVYVFKSTTIIWGMVFGFIIFKENISLNMIIGALITILGVSMIIKDGVNE